MTTPEKIAAGPWLKAAETSGRLDGTVIEYWKGGGQPPPYYQSNQLLLTEIDGKPIVQFNTIAYAKVFAENTLLLRFQLPATAEDIRQAAYVIRQSQLLNHSFAQEVKLGGSDILSFEVMLRHAKNEVAKRYFKELPSELNAVGAYFNSLMERALKKGKRSAHLDGKPLEATSG